VRRDDLTLRRTGAILSTSAGSPRVTASMPLGRRALWQLKSLSGSGQITNFSQVVTERERQITMLVEEREKIFNSNSWNVTSPLRYLRRKTGDLLRREQ
jgi:hypothetical protein